MKLPDDCQRCGNTGAIEHEERPVADYCPCAWGRFLRQKDEQGSLYSLRAFILRLAEPTP